MPERPLGKVIEPANLLTVRTWETSRVPVVVRFQRPKQGTVHEVATQWLQRALLGGAGEIVAVSAFTQGEAGNETQVLVYTLMLLASRAAELPPPVEQK